MDCHRSVVAIVGDCYLVRKVSPTGQLITHWRKQEGRMPQIPSNTLDTAVYLYPSKDDAENCVDAGGSGFLIAVSGKGGSWIYVVTNSHVAQKCKTVRLNTIAETKAIVEPEVWIEHPDPKTDLAIAPLGFRARMNIYRFQVFMPQVHFIDKTRLIDYRIGVGDDCYMIGRFVNHEGYQRNLPTARFGAIAQMPGEKIWTKWGEQEDAYLVDVRSISGFSGSPVVVRIPSWRARQLPIEGATCEPWFDWHMLLGIDCGHSIDKGKSLYEAREKEPLKDFEVEYNTGLAIVIPAWKLQEVIDCEKASKMREEDKREYDKRTRGTRLDVREASTQLTKPKKGAPVSIPIPTHEHFEHDLAKATRKRSKT